MPNTQTSVPAFVASQVLTAQQQTEINTGIPVFATTVTRDAAFGGAGEKALAEGQFAYIEATNVTQYYDGAAWQSVGFAPTYAIFNETQASGTNGGATATGSFLKKTLNTTVTNTITSCTLTSSVISLPAGTYFFIANGTFFQCTSAQLRLQNTTAATTIQIGTNAYSASGTSIQNTTQIYGFTTLTTTSNIELQYQASVVRATNGLGVATNFGNEVYSQIQITKVA